MDNLLVSQVLSVSAPQQEVDQAGKAQNQALLGQLTRDGIMLSMIQQSMEEVHAVLNTEKEDPLLEKDDDEESDSQESE